MTLRALREMRYILKVHADAEAPPDGGGALRLRKRLSSAEGRKDAESLVPQRIQILVYVVILVGKKEL
ncbi:MAG: hypothetical protein ABR574_10985 [Cryomorphaceae bacterium]